MAKRHIDDSTMDRDFTCPKCGWVTLRLHYEPMDKTFRITCERCNFKWIEKGEPDEHPGPEGEVAAGLQRRLHEAQVRFEEMKDDRDNECTLRLATLENLKRERVARKQAQQDAAEQRALVKRLREAGVTDYSKLTGVNRVDCHFCPGVWRADEPTKHKATCPLAKAQEEAIDG